MDYLEWNPSFSVGNPDMDSEHKVLFGIVNRLYENVEIEKDPRKLWGMITALIDYSQYHFADEEEILLKANYPGISIQQQEHSQFTSKIIEFRDQFSESHVEVTPEIFRFLKNWLTNHIKVQDKAYAAFIAAHGNQ